MGKYDNLDKNYFTEPAHLAELITNGVYHGKMAVEPTELEMLGGNYPSLAGSSGELKRDCICLCRSQGIKYGLEIENYADYGMPRRTLVYDACEYEREAADIRNRHEKARDLKDFAERKSGMTKEEGYYPIINTVLYLGQGHYKGRRALRECFRIPERIQPYVFERIQNYTFCLIEADYVNPEDYQTELRQFFQVMQCRNNRRKLTELFEREEFQTLSTQTQKIMAVHLDNKEIIKKVVEEEEEMCKAIRDMKRYERNAGRQEGKQAGKQEGLLFALKNLMETAQVSAEQAMDLLKITGEERTSLKALL